MQRLFGISVLIAAVAGCATLTVSSHIERDVNFADYVTWDWGPSDDLPVGDPRLDNNPFFRDYVEGTVERILVRKGYERAVTGMPDLLIHYHANVAQKVDVYGADYPYGYCYGNCEARIVEFEQGTIVLDVVDTATNKVVWRGWVQDAMTGIIDDQERLRSQVFEGMAKMMVRLPNGGAALR